MKKIEMTIECPSCKGTGLYQGMAEGNEVAVVCKDCGGTGAFKYSYSYNEFTGRKTKKGVKRLHEDEEDTSDMNKNQIKILKETPVEYVDMEVEMGCEAKRNLLEYALENIKNDENSLISWAAQDILKKQIEKQKKL